MTLAAAVELAGLEDGPAFTRECAHALLIGGSKPDVLEDAIVGP